MINKENELKTSTNSCSYRHDSLIFVSILSPCDETCSDGRPGDTAGVGLLAVLLLLLFAAAAQTAKIDGQAQEVEAESGSRHTAQEYERL